MNKKRHSGTLKRRWGAFLVWTMPMIGLGTKKKIIFLLMLVLSLSGFTQLPEIRDIVEIPQDHRIFLGRQAQELDRLDQDLQKKADAFHNEMYFSPWHLEKSRFTLDEVKWEFDKYSKDLGYGRNGERHSGIWIRNLTANAQLEIYDELGFPAITIQNTDLRVLPTAEAHLSDPKNCLLPFDNMQNSAVSANTPLLVSHISRDKKWVLAETHYAMGWIPVSHIARVDAAFMKKWENGSYAVITKDKTPIYSEAGKILFRLPLGSFFPKTGENEKGIQIRIATADKEGRALIKETILPKDVALPKPLQLTPANIASIANELINKPYGWGGLDQKRDCSSLVMDFFSPFGIWMPRNSSHQAKRTGLFIDLKNLSPKEKERMILKEGIPYLTLLWLKGHIMLYIGNQKDRALVFHNFWSVKTRDANGKTGKRIVGKAAITTLRPGRELRQRQGTGDILPSIRGMTVLWPPPTSPVEMQPGDEEGYNIWE